MRASSEVLIFVDVPKAIQDGYKFFLSANGVVLTEGNKDGFLPPEYFKSVEDRNGGPETQPCSCLIMYRGECLSLV